MILETTIHLGFAIINLWKSYKCENFCDVFNTSIREKFSQKNTVRKVFLLVLPMDLEEDQNLVIRKLYKKVLGFLQNKVLSWFF